jgi:nucleosome binding factor SPN SPT16 subunit
MQVQLNSALFNSRLSLVLDGWNAAGKSDDHSSIAGAEALLLTAGDPAGEEEPIRKGTCFQVTAICLCREADLTRLQTWLLGYEFPSTSILFEKKKVSILCSASKGTPPRHCKRCDSAYIKQQKSSLR